MGEDMVASQLVLPAGHILRPVDLGAAAGCGHTHIWVARKPKVAVLPTGSELVPIGTKVKPGEIIEYNSMVLSAQVTAWGGEAARYPITPDNLKSICDQINLAAANADLILLNAGSSAGSEDFSARAVESLGEVLVHGIAVRPGHPVILGMVVRQQKTHLDQKDLVPIIGVPGYPVSTALTGEIFVEPLLALWTGRKPAEPEIAAARLTRKITSPPGDDDYMRVVVGKVGDNMLAAPLSRGSGVITSLVRADGLVLIPRGLQGLEAGSEVKVRLYRPKNELENSIFAIGSHDMTLDLLSQFLFVHQRRLVSANVGSLAGLVALKRGEAHIAGSHLLDPQSGVYNLSYIERYLSGVPVKVVELVGREQGLIVQKGNPKRSGAWRI
jgi:putative molybdopterin biosynthesis protein